MGREGGGGGGGGWWCAGGVLVGLGLKNLVSIYVSIIILLGDCMALQGVWRWQFISLKTGKNVKQQPNK